jgi:hypothetical protein
MPEDGTCTGGEKDATNDVSTGKISDPRGDEKVVERESEKPKEGHHRWAEWLGCPLDLYAIVDGEDVEAEGHKEKGDIAPHEHRVWGVQVFPP